MARKWTEDEEQKKFRELYYLYVKKNKTIREIGDLLSLNESTIYDRLKRLEISSLRSKKLRYNNRRNDIVLPQKYSEDLAEFVGILLGDGHLSPTQVTVTLGKKDIYAPHVVRLMRRLFGVKPKNIVLRRGDRVIYLGSTKIVRWFLKMGLVHNKTKDQVDVPQWIFSQKQYMRAVLRGLFDTDGSVYKLKFGVQISFCNHSKPLIVSVRRMLLELNFSPSRATGKNIYLTKQKDLYNFFHKIGFKNLKHKRRFLEFVDLKYGRFA